MTDQTSDKIYYKGRQALLLTEPLNAYLSAMPSRPEFAFCGTHCWRGYWALWEIDDGVLYLYRFAAGRIVRGTDGKATVVNFGLRDLFPEKHGRVAASWFTGELQLGRGGFSTRALFDYRSGYGRKVALAVKEGRILSQEALDEFFRDGNKQKTAHQEILDEYFIDDSQLPLDITAFDMRVSNHLDDLIEEVAQRTGDRSIETISAWRMTLPKVAAMLAGREDSAELPAIHPDSRIAIAYTLPGAESRCDLVLLGSGETFPAVVIVQLTNRNTADDEPGQSEGLMLRRGEPFVHPSARVRCYAEHLRHHHSAVRDFHASVHGCVVFTEEQSVAAYWESPNSALAGEFPCLTLSPSGEGRTFLRFLSARLPFHSSCSHKDKFARAFANGGCQEEPT